MIEFLLNLAISAAILISQDSTPNVPLSAAQTGVQGDKQAYTCLMFEDGSSACGIVSYDTQGYWQISR